MTNLTTSKAILAIGIAALATAGHAGAHAEIRSSYELIYERAIENAGCLTGGCHGGSGVSGGLRLDDRDGAWAELVGFGFGQPAANAAAADYGKMRVDPGRPWNSYFVDKLRGLLKAGEGKRMPLQGYPMDECTIREVERWILAGAPRDGYVETDRDPFEIDDCSRQPARWSTVEEPCDAEALGCLGPVPTAPAATDGFLLHAVGEATREHNATATVLVDPPADPRLVRRIEVFAGPAVQAVELRPLGSASPTMVALFPPNFDVAGREVLELPAGHGLSLGEDTPLQVSFRFYGDHYARGAAAPPPVTPEAYLRFEWAEPQADRLGTRLSTVGSAGLMTLPRGVSVTGGSSSHDAGRRPLMFRMITDRRAARSAVVGLRAPTPAVHQFNGAWPPPYVSEDLSGPAGLDPILPYLCQHDHSPAQRPLRFGCAAPRATAMGMPVPPEGQPSGASAADLAPWCDDDGDCGFGLRCVPVALLEGPGPEDGRCDLFTIYDVGPD